MVGTAATAVQDLSREGVVQLLRKLYASAEEASNSRIAELEGKAQVAVTEKKFDEARRAIGDLEAQSRQSVWLATDEGYCLGSLIRWLRRLGMIGPEDVAEFGLDPEGRES